MLLGLIIYLMSAHPANAEELLDTSVCASFAAYQQPAGVEYQPGVDVHGKPVVEADVSPSAVEIPKKFSFDITVDMAKRMGMNVPQGMEAQAKMGTVTFDNGKLFFDGKPMEGEAELALREICQPKPLQKDKKVSYNN